MIPKIIHFCWFSNDKKPKLIRRCIKSWKKILPDYEIKCWDANSFDFDSVPFVKQAYSKKKWAFVADYVRLYALYTEGGIYLDSDVEVYKKFDEFLNYSFFSGTDIRSPKFDFFAIEAAIMGSEKGHPFIKECMDYYNNLQFINNDGSLKMKEMPDVISPFLEKYGYQYKNETQRLSKNIVIFSSSYFANCNALNYNNIYARHWNTNSWVLNRGKVYNYFYSHDLIFIYKFIEKIISKTKKLF